MRLPRLSDQQPALHQSLLLPPPPLPPFSSSISTKLQNHSLYLSADFSNSVLFFSDDGDVKVRKVVVERSFGIMQSVPEDYRTTDVILTFLWSDTWFIGLTGSWPGLEKPLNQMRVCFYCYLVGPDARDVRGSLPPPKLETFMEDKYSFSSKFY